MGWGEGVTLKPFPEFKNRNDLTQYSTLPGFKWEQWSQRALLGIGITLEADFLQSKTRFFKTTTTTIKLFIEFTC